MKTSLRIEVAKAADKTMEAAIWARELQENFKTETNGQFVVFTIECTPLEAFKLGMCYHNLVNA